jgi:signal transduction histidine kinase
VEEETRALGGIISTNALEIEQRWLQCVTENVARTQGIEPTQLRDGIPDYLAALSEALRGRSDEADVAGAAIWAKIAHEHGITRVRIGFDIDQLVQEFVALRHVIREVAIEHGVPTDGAEAMLADLIDAAITEAVRAYVHARDYETRRVQAEHIGFLTHELRNPLMAAISAADLLRQEASPDQIRRLDVLDRNHRRLMELIDGVLDTARLVVGSIKPKLVVAREGEILDSATEAALAVANKKGLSFEVLCNPERRIRLDPELTRSAIQNLADNAVKYTDAGAVEISVDDTETTWSVHVRDTCNGLSREELRTIFDPFRRGSTRKQGTGLGLAITRRAIEAQSGTIHAESPGPVGCHFWFTLPKR